MRSRYRGAFLSSSYPLYKLKIFQYAKNYFVCKKISCWSTNYIQQKYDESKKFFGNYYPKYKVQPVYKQNL